MIRGRHPQLSTSLPPEGGSQGGRGGGVDVAEDGTLGKGDALQAVDDEVVRRLLESRVRHLTGGGGGDNGWPRDSGGNAK